MKPRHSALRVLIVAMTLAFALMPMGAVRATDLAEAVDVFQRGRATFALELPSAMPDVAALDGYDLGLSFTQYVDPITLAIYFTFRPDLGEISGDINSLDQQIRQSGWRQTYHFGLGTFRTETVDQYAWAILQVTEAEDEAGAQEIYRTLSDAAYTAQQRFEYIQMDGASEAILVGSSGLDQSNSQFEMGISLAAIGRFVIGVTATAYDGYALDQSVFTALPEMVADRLNASAPYSDQPGLSWTVPRIRDIEYWDDDDGYRRILDTQQRLYYQDESSFDEADAFWNQVGVSNIYGYEARISDSDQEIGFRQRTLYYLYDFDSESEAQAAFSGWTQFMEEGGYDSMSGVRSEALAAELGGDVVSYSYSMTFDSGARVDGYYIMVIAGSNVIEMYFDSPLSPNRTAAAIYALAAYACQFSASACPEITNLSTMSG